MSRKLLNAITLAVGLLASVFGFFSAWTPALLAMMICGVAWVVLGRVLAPVGVVGGPILYYYRYTLIIVAVAWCLGNRFLPTPLYVLSFQIIDAGFLVLVLGYAYANYFDE